MPRYWIWCDRDGFRRSIVSSTCSRVGAYHWRAEQAGVPIWFVTYDRLGNRHTATSLAAEYAGAIELAEGGLEFVHAPVRARSGDVMLPVADGALSCTRWVTGEVVGEGPLTEGRTAEENIAALRRLHSSAAPDQIARWQSMVGPDLGARLGPLVTEPWVTGPYGEPARVAIADRLADVRAWTDRCAELPAMAVDRPWVPTHGETHTSNQVRTAEGILFVDWESFEAGASGAGPQHAGPGRLRRSAACRCRHGGALRPGMAAVGDRLVRGLVRLSAHRNDRRPGGV